MPHPLRLLEPPDPAPRAEDTLLDVVRETRRRLARRMRALQLAGLGVADWSAHTMSRMAHADAVSAEFLRNSREVAPDVERAVAVLAAAHAWMLERLDASEQQLLRRYELRVRLETQQLVHPLLQPELVRQGAEDLDDDDEHELCSLRAGLARLDDLALTRICERLGIRHTLMGRDEVQRRIRMLLRDADLQRILLSTLSDQAQALLIRLIRTPPSELQLRQLAQAVLRHVPGAADELHRCALLFAGQVREERPVWIPNELRRGLDGILRSWGW